MSESSSLCVHAPASPVNRIVWERFSPPFPVSSAPLLLTAEWQTKIIQKSSKRPGEAGLNWAELAALLSAALGPRLSASCFSLGKPGALSGWKGYI